MKIKQEVITQKLEDQDYLQDLETVKYSDLTNTKINSLVSKMIKEVGQANKHNSLIQTQLAVSGQRAVTFALESNIINLPFVNYKKISNFCNDELDYEVNIYFETISDYINVSKFRIDIVASMAEIVSDPDKYITQISNNISDKLKIVRSYTKPEKKKTEETKTINTKKKTKK